MRTQVGLVGAGPAGLLLAHLLRRQGVESIVVENRSREYIEGRVRAGVLEQGTVDMLNGAGVGERMNRQGLVHHGIELGFAGRRVLSRALASFYESGQTDLLARYSETCLRRVWRAEHFSWWMTSLLHRFPDHGPFQQRLQIAELEYVASSRAAAMALAENYVGLTFDET